MYVTHVTSYSVRCHKTSRKLWIPNAADQADDVLFDDEGDETNDEDEFLEESDTELWDEGMSEKTSISSI